MNKDIQNKFTILRLKKEITILQSYIKTLEKGYQLRDNIIKLLQGVSIVNERIIERQSKWIKENQIFFIITMVIIFGLGILNLYINK